MNNYRYIFLMLILFFFSACSYLQPHQNFQNSDYRDSTLYLKTRFAINSEKINSSGTVYIYAHPDFIYFNFQDPFYKSVLELYFQEKELLLFNHQEKTHNVFQNTKHNREKILSVDLSLQELRSIFWGQEISEENNLIFIKNHQGIVKTIIKKTNTQNITVHIQTRKIFNSHSLPHKISITTNTNARLKIVAFEATVNPDLPIKKIDRN